MQRVALGFSWICVVPHSCPVTPNAFALLRADNSAFDLWLLAMQLITYKLFTRVVPPNSLDIGYQSDCSVTVFRS
jgi:hypothetical protein